MVRLLKLGRAVYLVGGPLFLSQPRVKTPRSDWPRGVVVISDLSSRPTANALIDVPRKFTDECLRGWCK
jgi:hypothetical protein